jgi:acyl-coenzyme A synthetase/AMP-(fatty) acid ligase
VLFQTPEAEVTAEAFLRASTALGGRLAEMFAAKEEDGESGSRRLVLNACQDRLFFALGFAAALLAGATSLLSAERDPERRALLARRHRGAILLGDAAVEGEGEGLTLSPGFLAAPAPPDGSPTALETGMDTVRAEPAALVFTSGSTGEPVPHPKSWPALWARSAALAPCFGFAEGAPVSVVGTVPPQHMYGFETTLLLAFHAPVRVWCGPAFYPADIARALTALPAPRVLVTTPLQLRALLEAHLTLPPLFRIVSATAPLAPELAARAEETLGCEVFEIFGATEVGSIAFRRTLAGETWEMLAGLSLSVGPRGEVRAAGLGMAPTPLADVLEILDTTHFRLVGRRTDIIKLAGKRASLAALNHLLTTLPGVEDGAFVLPDEEAGRAPRLIALVVAPALTDEAILEGLRARLDPVFLPRRVIRLPALPRNEFGKLPRERLLALLRETDRAA